jgi:hypothetical protein
MAFKVGTPKPLDEISAQDVQTHHIWLWVWEAGLEGEADDETWQCPVLETSDVSEAMSEPVITLMVKGSNIIGSASYNPQSDQLEAISIWEGDTWIGVQETTLPTPISFVAVPTIRGMANVEFVCTDPSDDRASRAG